MDTMKAVLRGKFIHLNVYIKKMGKSYNNDLTVHLRALRTEKERKGKKQTHLEGIDDRE